MCTVMTSASSNDTHRGSTPSLAQQCQQQHDGTTPPTITAIDSVASSWSCRSMDADHDTKHGGPAALSKLLSVFQSTMQRLAASRMLSGIAAPTPELQAAIEAAYAEVAAGSKLNIKQLYTMGHMLGSGHFARVFVATSKRDGVTYAVKVIPKTPNKGKARQQLQKVIKEVAVMRLLADHPCAVQLHQVVQDSTNYYLVMEHCSGGELFDRLYKLDHLPEAEAAYYLAQLASFLAHTHARNIVHRDIKPENMLLVPVSASDAPGGQQPSDAPCASEGAVAWRLKVVDYGCSAFCLPEQTLHESIGTVCYVAPEVLWHHYDAQSDVWSAGVVLYMLLCGYLPFDGKNNQETLLLVRAGDFDLLPEDWAHVSAAGQDLVKQLLAYKPADRPTAAQLLQHSWIQQGLKAGQQQAAHDTSRPPSATICELE